MVWTVLYLAFLRLALTCLRLAVLAAGLALAAFCLKVFLALAAYFLTVFLPLALVGSVLVGLFLASLPFTSFLAG